MKLFVFDTWLELPENFCSDRVKWTELHDYSGNEQNIRFEITYYPHSNTLSVSKFRAKTPKFQSFPIYPNIKTIHMKPKYIQRKRSGNFVINDYQKSGQEMIAKVFTPSHLYSFVKSQIAPSYDIIYKEYGFSHKKTQCGKFTQSMALNAFDIRTSKKAIEENFADINKWA
jgi:hypothetical protein